MDKRVGGRLNCDPSNMWYSRAHWRWLWRCDIQIDIYFTLLT